MDKTKSENEFYLMNAMVNGAEMMVSNNGLPMLRFIALRNLLIVEHLLRVGTIKKQNDASKGFDCQKCDGNI